MKKLFIALLVLLLLCGCSGNEYEGNALLSKDVTKAFFKMDGKEYTNNDIFQLLKAQAVSSELEPLIAKAMLESRSFDYDSKKEDIEESYDLAIEMYGEETVTMYYGTKDDYIKQVLESSDPSFLLEELIKDKINEYDTKYKPIYIDLLITSNKSKATRFQTFVKKGAEFEKTFKNVGLKEDDGDTTYATVYSTTSPDLPDEVNEAIKNLTKENSYTDVIEVVETAESEDAEDTYTYYVVKLRDENVKVDNIDEFTSFIASKESLTSFVQLLDDNTKIEFYDDDFSYAFNQLKNQFANPTEVAY